MNRRRHPRLSLDLLRGFRVAARQLSFTRAARELSVTQPAVSREIRTLEDQLGLPLFRRVNRALQLTKAGEELYRAVDEALGIIDGATERLVGSGGTLAITTTTALASLWLVPKLPRFTRAHPDVDVRVAASNDMVDLASEHLDVAIRFVLPGGDVPRGQRLVDYKQFPVCSPRIVRSRARPLRGVADLDRHVLLDFETVLYGRAWYDWERWSDAMNIRAFRTAGTMRFSHYDQVIRAAIEGGGVAIGKWPHLANHLREGTLCAPLGRDTVASLGSFYIVVAPGAEGRGAVTAFAAWLKEEIRRDAELAPEMIRESTSAPGRAAGSGQRRPPR